MDSEPGRAGRQARGNPEVHPETGRAGRLSEETQKWTQNQAEQDDWPEETRKCKRIK